MRKPIGWRQSGRDNIVQVINFKQTKKRPRDFLIVKYHQHIRMDNANPFEKGSNSNPGGGKGKNDEKKIHRKRHFMGWLCLLKITPNLSALCVRNAHALLGKKMGTPMAGGRGHNQWGLFRGEKVPPF